MSENVRYLDAALYEDLAAWELRTRKRGSASRFPRREAAASMLYREARLLDQGDYEGWLELYSAECIYWVPAAADCADPRHEASVHFDDRRRLLDRIALIRSGYLHAQTPASRTSRTIGNIETWESAHGALEVRSTFGLWEHRRGVTTLYAGVQEHLLAGDGEDWRIARRLLRLIDSDQPLGNLTFIL